MRRRFLTLVVAPCLAAAVLAACGGSPEAGGSGPIKVGGLLDETGAAAPNGQAALDGAKLAIAEVNKAGGINGRKIEFVQDDPGFNVGRATALLRRFSSDKNVVALIGPNSDSVSTPLTEQVNSSKIVSLVTSGAGGRPNSEFGKWMFSIPVRNDFIIDHVAEALQELKLTKVAVVYSTSRPFAVSASDYFKAAAAKHGLEIVGSPIGFADDDVNFDSLITKIKSQDDVQAIFCSCLAGAAGPMILQANRAGLDARWVSDASLLDPNFYQLSQGTANGTMVATPFDAERNPEAAKFISSFKDEYDRDPNVYAAYGYDSALVLIKALKSISGDITRESVRDAIAGISFDGATGKIEFPDGHGVATRDAAYVVEMEGGKFVPLAP